ncbi:MAG: DUF47 family protein [Desulfovibrio sp.]|jgi:uncharacterized protein Yka (UPF0111/DUF47 family)|nr:DUF47 family protein [Desulfovibrio sp.]
MFNFLLPKSAPFFALMLEQNDKLRASSAALTVILENVAEMEQRHREISILEAEADKIHARIARHLSRSFITPIDREDILHITKAQEEAIDNLFNTANRLYIFEFPQMRFPMLRLGHVLQDMILLTGSMLRGLAEKRDSHETRAFRALRNDSEMLLSMGLVELHDLDSPTPAGLLETLKWIQVYDRLESAVNRVVELAETIDEAVLKNV